MSNNRSHTLLEQVNLDDLTLYIKEGEFLSIVRPSGCGRSTLLNILVEFDNSNDREILIDGKLLTRSANICRIVFFQEGALFQWLTVYENVEFGLEASKLPRNERYNDEISPHGTFVTHNIEEAVALEDRVIAMSVVSKQAERVYS
jgi:NitT/TauT family transport system ATP-binding protein